MSTKYRKDKGERHNKAEGHVGKEMPHNQFLVGCARSSFSWFVVGAGSSSHRAAAGDSN